MNKSFFFSLALILAVALSNFWIWRIFNYNIYLGISEIIASFFLLRILVSNSVESKTKNITILIIITLLQLILIRSDFNLKLEETKPVEILQAHDRELYYSQELGKLFLNKLSLNYYHNWDLYFYKFQRNLFYQLDYNQYFFASHPRERGLYEFEKYIFVELPFFMVGLIWLILKVRNLNLLYILLILIISIFIDPAFRLGPIFLFPLINCLISIGFLKAKLFLKI